MKIGFHGLSLLIGLLVYGELVQAGTCRPGIGINLEGVRYWTRGMPFNDLAKISPAWDRPWDSSLKETPLDLDDNGYLRTVDEGFADTLVHDDAWGRFEASAASSGAA